MGLLINFNISVMMEVYFHCGHYEVFLRRTSTCMGYVISSGYYYGLKVFDASSLIIEYGAILAYVILYVGHWMGARKFYSAKEQKVLDISYRDLYPALLGLSLEIISDTLTYIFAKRNKFTRLSIVAGLDCKLRLIFGIIIGAVFYPVMTQMMLTMI